MMKTPKLTVKGAVGLIAISALLTSVTAGRLTLRPLTPSELRRALIEAGVEETQLAPQGRATPSAFAGLGGFALGVANGLGGALIFDLLTSNETAAYVTNLINSLNTTTTTTSGTSSGATTQEVCFASRSLDGDQPQLLRSSDQYDDQNEDGFVDYEDDDEELDELEAGRQVEYYDDYADTANGGLTCIVVNKGRAILRHRRSVEKPA